MGRLGPEKLLLWKGSSMIRSTHNEELFPERWRKSSWTFKVAPWITLPSWSELLTCRFITRQFLTCWNLTDNNCKSGKIAAEEYLLRDSVSGLSAPQSRSTVWWQGGRASECKLVLRWTMWVVARMQCSSSLLNKCATTKSKKQRVRPSR